MTLIKLLEIIRYFMGWVDKFHRSHIIAMEKSNTNLVNFIDAHCRTQWSLYKLREVIGLLLFLLHPIELALSIQENWGIMSINIYVNTWNINFKWYVLCSSKKKWYVLLP